MTDETLLRDRLELERLRDAFVRLDRINGVEKAVAVLQTKFDGLLEKLKGAVSDDDLKALKREMEERMKEAISDVRKYIDDSNEQWAKEILGANRTLMAETRLERLEEQRRFRGQMILTVFSAALSIIGALFIFYLTTGRP